jgi:predicted RNA-binding Zn ribbon-like protein
VVNHDMDEHEKRQVGEQVEPGGRPKAPGRLQLLQRYINTWNHDFPPHRDRLGTPRKASTWLRQKGLIAAGSHTSAADAVRLRELREAIRSLVVANLGGPPDPTAVEILRAASRTAGVIVTTDEDGRTHLEPQRAGIDGAVATLLSIMHEAQLTDDWRRLKACRQCRYAFYDRSKNRSAAWCAMSICGNRAKNRAHYQRQHRP